MTQNIPAQLATLLDRGSIAKSACSSSLLRILQTLVDTKVIVEERSGAGRRLLVRDAAALRGFIVNRFPGDAAFAGASSRITGVGHFRDSKALANDAAEVVILRAWKSSALLKNGEAVEAVTATQRHGVFAILLGADSPYSLTGGCALVENPALFACFERMNLPIGLAIYGQGRISGRLLRWLQQQQARNFSLLHLPDYDPVGLNEFGRLRASLGERVCLHLPADLAERFARHSNPSLLDRPHSRSVLASLRTSPHPEIQFVLQLIQRHNAALEQEALVLPD